MQPEKLKRTLAGLLFELALIDIQYEPLRLKPIVV